MSVSWQKAKKPSAHFLQAGFLRVARTTVNPDPDKVPRNTTLHSCFTAMATILRLV